MGQWSRGEESEQQPGSGGTRPAANGGVQQGQQQGEQGEIEQARGVFAAELVDDRVDEIAAHRHHRPDEAIRLEGQQVVSRHIGGDREVHGQAVGAGFGLEHGEPVDDEDQGEEGEGEPLRPARQGREGGDAQARAAERDRDGEEDEPDCRVVNGEARQQGHRDEVKRDAEEDVGSGTRGVRAGQGACPDQLAQAPGREEEKGHRENGFRKQSEGEENQQAGGEAGERQGTRIRTAAAAAQKIPANCISRAWPRGSQICWVNRSSVRKPWTSTASSAASSASTSQGAIRGSAARILSHRKSDGKRISQGSRRAPASMPRIEAEPIAALEQSR